MPPRPKRLKIINQKVNKIMHSTVLNTSRAIGNFLFPTYEVVITSSLHSFLLKITVNHCLWILTLSLKNFIGWCERCCSLRVLSHLVRLPVRIRVRMLAPPLPPAGLCSCYLIWVRTAVHLHNKASSCLPRCLVMTAQEKAANCIVALFIFTYVFEPFVSKASVDYSTSVLQML